MIRHGLIDKADCINAINDRLDQLEEKAIQYYAANKMTRYAVMKDITNEVRYVRSEIVGNQPCVEVWHSVKKDGLPEKRYDKKFDMPIDYLATIKGASVPTILNCDEFGNWWDEYDNMYNVIAWAELPHVYKGE